MKIFGGYILQESNQIILIPAPIDIFYEIKRILLGISGSDRYCLGNKGVIMESLIISGLSLAFFFLLRIINIFVLYENLPVINFCIHELDMNTFGFVRFAWFSLVSSFFICSMLNVSIQTLKLLFFYPIDFFRLPNNSDCYETLLRSMSVHGTIFMKKSAVSSWKTSILAQQRQAEMLLEASSTTQYCGFPKLSSFWSKSMGQNIGGLLAWQDFERSVRFCQQKRALLFDKGI